MKHLDKSDLESIVGRLTDIQGADWLLNQLVEALSSDELEQNLAYIVNTWDLNADFPELDDVEY